MANNIENILSDHNQQHLTLFVDELSDEKREGLKEQIKNIDFNELDLLIERYVKNLPITEIPSDLEPAPYFPAIPQTPEQEELYAKAKVAGEELLAKGEVAALTVAGGQGTRLGFDGPKGTFPITPVTNMTLFQYFAESLIRAGEKFGNKIPWFIMTSQLNDKATKDFFTAHKYFGIDPDSVMFFQQGTMPAIAYDGKLLLADKNSLALAPDGHGGTLLALRKSGALKTMEAKGVKYISYFQVDNPLVSVIDPLFVGLHHLENSEMSARMLAKTGPFEKLGNFCISNGNSMIIEYSDMPDELAKELDDNGNLRFLAGSPAIHIISREFVSRLTEGGQLRLPWHRADKKVAYLDENGVLVNPEDANAVKLESFIFDALPLAKRTMIFEAERENEFAPTKNRTGIDSVESCQQMLIERDAKRLEKAGINIPRDANGVPNCVIELSPRHFFDTDDLINFATENKLQAPLPQEKKCYP